MNKLFEFLYKNGTCTRLSCLTGFTQLELPVWAAIRPNGLSGSSTLGKGLTDESSQYSALFECYELSVAEQLQPSDIFSLPPKLNQFLFHPPHIYDVSVPVCIGRKLSDGEMSYIPFSCLSMDTTLFQHAYRCSTIGTGAGWTAEQATQSAVREFIERFSKYRTEHERPFIRLVSSEESPVSGNESLNLLLHLCWEKRYEVFIKDLTTVAGWACFSVRLFALSEHGTMVGCGYGCAPEPAYAITQAILEANQGICVGVSGMRDDMSKSLYLISRSDFYRWQYTIDHSSYSQTSLYRVLLQAHLKASCLIDQNFILNNLLIFDFPRISSDDDLFCCKVLMPLCALSE